MKGLSSLSVKKTCTYGEMDIPHETEVCDNGECMICKDGVFEDYPDPHAPKYGLHVSIGPT